MDRFFREFNDIDWRTYDTFAAIDALRRFYAESERLIDAGAKEAVMEHGPKWRPESDEEIGEYLSEQRLSAHLHEEVIRPTLRYATVTSVFAVFERELRRFMDNLAREQKVPLSYRELRGGLLGQVGRHLETFNKIHIATLPGYAKITDLQKVRDCIVHCYGEVALSRDKAHLTKMDAARDGVTAIDGTMLEIGPRFIESSVTALRSFFVALFTAAGWKINDRWQS